MIEKVYQKLPKSIQYAAKYAYGTIPLPIRYGKVFRETHAFLQKSQWWSREQLEEYQLEQLSKLLEHAYENVPYYRRVFDERGLKPKDIQEFKDLQQLPYLTKEIIQENLEDLKARNYSPSKFQYVTTGGSTGIPLGFYHERGVSDAKEWAFMLAQWNRVGFKMGDRCVVLRGNVVESASKGKFWEYAPVNKNLILSSYHLTDENMPKYIKKISEFKPDFIQAYPSSITILATFMKEHDAEPFPNVKAILCGSENLYSWQLELLEEVFQRRAYSWYGHTEQAALAGECEKSTYYHIFPEYGIVELIGKDGKPVTDENQMGEIVATGFNNFACPFIRYKTMDLAINTNKKCGCGRNYRLIKEVEGRKQDFFVDKNGSLITFIAHDYALWKVKDKINAYQYVQNDPGKVLLKIDAKSKFSISDMDSVKRTFLHFYSGFDIEIKFVENIPRTDSGKFRYLIQKLPIGLGDLEYEF